MRHDQTGQRDEQSPSEEVIVTRDHIMSMHDLFVRAKRDCAAVFDRCVANHWRRVALVGGSHLAVIAITCAARAGVTVVAVIDPAESGSWAGRPVVRDLAEAITAAGGATLDAVIITDPRAPQANFEAMQIAMSQAGLSNDRLLAETFAD